MPDEFVATASSILLWLGISSLGVYRADVYRVVGNGRWGMRLLGYCTNSPLDILSAAAVRLFGGVVVFMGAWDRISV